MIGHIGGSGETFYEKDNPHTLGLLRGGAVSRFVWNEQGVVTLFGRDQT